VKVWELNQGLFFLMTKSKLKGHIGPAQGLSQKGEKREQGHGRFMYSRTVKFVLPFEYQLFRPRVITLSVITSRRTANDLVPCA
jgi:hypothetical protein